MRILMSVLAFSSLSLVGSTTPFEGPKLGDRAPDFELKDSAGKAFRLYDFKGQNVVLEFIRSGSW